MYMSTPVLEGGVLYGMTHRRKGQFVAVDPRTGKTLWVAEGRAGDNASVVSAWGALLLLTTDGTLTVARPDPKVFAPVRTYTVAESAVWAHPAVAGDSLYIKDAQSLTRWRIP
jgi:outer membrane protein assembly factor BamB